VSADEDHDTPEYWKYAADGVTKVEAPEAQPDPDALVIDPDRYNAR